MTRTLVSTTAIAIASLVASAPAGAARTRRATPTHNQTRPEGGPSALGLPGTHSGQMVRIQQQRAQRGAARKKPRQSPREQLLAARDRQLGVTGGQATFNSRREAAAYTRMRARVIQIRTFAVAVATGIGGGFFAKMVTAMGVLQSGYHDLPGDPNFGNPMAQVLDHNFAIGAVIGAGVALVVGSVRAAQLRRRADAIERGEVDVDLTRLD